jgi:hypothetical protein
MNFCTLKNSIITIAEAGTLVKFQEQVLSDISDVISYRIRELERKTPQVPDPNADSSPPKA